MYQGRRSMYQCLFVLFYLFLLNYFIFPFLIRGSIPVSKPSKQLMVSVNTAINEKQLMESLKPIKFYKPIESITINQHWQVVNDPTKEIYLYSAFYDDRNELEKPVIRINGVMEDDVSFLICLLWYRNRVDPDVVFARLIKVGAAILQREKTFTPFIFSCDAIIGRWPPSHVSMVTPDSLLPSNMLAVEQPEIPTAPHDFAICVPLQSGDIEANILLEWIVIQKVLQVDKIFIYQNNINDYDVQRVLDRFVKDGLVEVIPAPECMTHSDQNTIELSVAATLNDCLYRNLYLYKNILVIGLEELVIPRGSNTFFGMIWKIDDEQKTIVSQRAYTFQSAYYFLDFGPMEDDTTYFGRYLGRIIPRAKNSRSMTDPKICLALGKISCKVLLPKYNGTDWNVAVKPEFGMSHRYVRCSFDEVYKKPGMCNETIEKEGTTDPAILELIGKIYTQVGTQSNTGC